MTLEEVRRCNLSGGVQLITKDKNYHMKVDRGGYLRVNSNLNIPLDVILGEDWEIIYPLSLYPGDTIGAMHTLNKELNIRAGLCGEFSIWDRAEIEKTLYAIGRSLGLKLDLEGEQ